MCVCVQLPGRGKEPRGICQRQTESSTVAAAGETHLLQLQVVDNRLEHAGVKKSTRISVLILKSILEMSPSVTV